MLTLDGIGIAYGSGPLLFPPISHTLDAGTVVAVHGAHGSGKSSLLRLIAGLEAPTCGSIRLDGAAVRPGRPDEYARDAHVFGLVLPGHPLLASRTLYENLVLSQCLAGHPVRAAVDAAYAMLRRLDLTALADRYPRELTRSQHQMACVGRAALRRPRVLLVDEPGHGVQPSAAPLVQAVLKDAVVQGALLIMALTEDDQAAPPAGAHIALSSFSTSTALQC